MCERENISVCFCVSRERENMNACVYIIQLYTIILERERILVCVRESIERERERILVCVYVERDRESENMNECVFVCIIQL